MNLRLSVYDLKEHPQELMKRLGIEYEAWESAPLGDCCFFYGCSNLPNNLPPGLEPTGKKKEFVGTFLNGLTGYVSD